MTDRHSHSRGGQPREWFEEWFDHPLYLQVYHHRDAEEASCCARTILSVTGSEHNHSHLSLLDIACGAGRHAVAFARMGLRVTANDLSPFLLGQAEEMARKEGLSVEFSLQDMRTITFERQFDLIVQLFSSFGYFDSDKDDHDIISNITRLLRPDGWYVLDLLNQHYLRNHFIPYTERKAGALSITEERTLTERHVVKKLTLHEANGHEHSFTESVRLYTPEEAVRLLESGGLNVVRIVGDYNGGAFDASNSPRMMLFARLTHARC